MKFGLCQLRGVPVEIDDQGIFQGLTGLDGDILFRIPFPVHGKPGGKINHLAVCGQDLALGCEIRRLGLVLRGMRGIDRAETVIPALSISLLEGDGLPAGSRCLRRRSIPGPDDISHMRCLYFSAGKAFDHLLQDP